MIFFAIYSFIRVCKITTYFSICQICLFFIVYNLSTFYQLILLIHYLSKYYILIFFILKKHITCIFFGISRYKKICFLLFHCYFQYLFVYFFYSFISIFFAFVIDNYIVGQSSFFFIIHLIIHTCFYLAMAAHSSILAWRMPWTKDPGGL